MFRPPITLVNQSISQRSRPKGSRFDTYINEIMLYHHFFFWVVTMVTLRQSNVAGWNTIEFDDFPSKKLPWLAEFPS